MNDDSGNPRQTSNSSTIALVVLLLPLLYAPIFWLYEHTSLKQPLDSYMAWWERLGSRKM